MTQAWWLLVNFIFLMAAAKQLSSSVCRLGGEAQEYCITVQSIHAAD